MKHVQTGKNIEYNGQHYSLQIIKITLDHAFVKFTKIEQEPVVYRQLNTSAILGDVMTVTVPFFDTNILRAMRTRKIFYRKEFKIRKALYRLLMLRLMSGCSSIQDLIAYGRTLGGTYEITDNESYDLHNFSLSEFLSTIYFAWYMHNNAIKKIQVVKHLAEAF